MSTSPSWLESADQSGSSMLHERHLHARPDTRAIARSCAAREGCDSAQNKCSGFVRGGGDGGCDGRTLTTCPLAFSDTVRGESGSVDAAIQSMEVRVGVGLFPSSK
jgi:hypothetical protein